jgi:glutamine cyclotransferase
MLPETWTMTMEETNALRIFERKIVSKIRGLVKEGERWGIRSNKEIKDMQQGQDTVKFTKSRAAVMKYMRKTAG